MPCNMARLFAQLPPELRLHIFEHAVSPERPLVHIFRVREDVEKDELLLAAPGPSPAPANSNTGRSEPEPSAYYHDEGMWGACRDSRTVISRHYQSTMNRHIRIDALHEQDPEGGVWTPRRYNRLLLGPFRQENEDMNRTLTAIPKTDLICFRIDPDQDVGVFFDLAWWQAQGADQSLPCGLRGAHNLAFEYDAASWSFDAGTADVEVMMNEPGARGAFLHFLHELARVMPYEEDGEGRPFLPRVFLVDRDIRRKQVNWMGSYGGEWEFHGVGGESPGRSEAVMEEGGAGQRYIDITMYGR
ncbi:hypothetical protein CkaCkLH20_11809 [Colletotrichum karsti]|uniref:2EXR domain-containing protein n=1 Tax=Colletotrichum karsti TaxID=1095194 RepID=A0A9P6LFT7_9PEZI|nr:uncharacterized protein CkaCkLH20_11809 [Colletotrichum karsti]KAF9870707.1 hypothetical protein CkaCkLH20_11809 [Colletotrichum karsti]